MLQDFHGRDLRLGRGHIEGISLGLQLGQQAVDAVVGGVLKFPDGDIALPEDPNGLVDALLRHAEAGEALPQGRADKDPQLVPVPDLDAKVRQGRLGAVHNAGTGVGQGPVQIKKDRLGHGSRLLVRCVVFFGLVGLLRRGSSVLTATHRLIFVPWLWNFSS